MRGSLFINPTLYRHSSPKIKQLYVKRAKKTHAGAAWFQPVIHYDNTPKAIRYVSDGPIELWPKEEMIEQVSSLSS